MWKPFAPAFNADFDSLPRDAQKAAFAHMEAEPAKTFRNLKHAANELQSIRNDLVGASDKSKLKARVDAVGQWLAKNAKPTGKGAALIHEASSLAYKIETGQRLHAGHRIQIGE